MKKILGVMMMVGSMMSAAQAQDCKPQLQMSGMNACHVIRSIMQYNDGFSAFRNPQMYSAKNYTITYSNLQSSVVSMVGVETHRNGSLDDCTVTMCIKQKL